MMGADIKESGKMVIRMVKVKKIALLILTLFNTLIGKFFCNDGNIFEGEWEAGWINGKGKKFDSKGKLIEEG